MVDLIATVSTAGAVLVFVAGFVDLLVSWSVTQDTKSAIKKGAKQAQAVNEAVQAKADAGEAGVREYAGLDFSGNWKALAELATALKELDRSSRLFVISLAFLAVAGATVGLDSIGTGLGK